MRKSAPIVLAIVFLCLVIFASKDLFTEKSATEKMQTLPTGLDLDTANDSEKPAHYYASLHLVSPLMALPGADLETLNSSLAIFSTSSETSRQVYKEYIEPEVLYPLNLLQLFSDTEQSRQKMLADTNQETALLYHEALVHLFDEYKVALTNLQANISKFDPTTIFFWSGGTNSQYVVDTLKEELRDLAVAKKNEELRFKCLNDIKQCPKIDEIKFPKISTSPTTTNEVADLTEIKDRADFFANYHVRLRDQTADNIKEKDIVLLNNSQCAVDSKPVYWLIAKINSRISHLPEARAFMLNDIYLNDVSLEQASGFLPTDIEIPEAYRYSVQISNYYTCIDYGFDKHTALSVLYIRDHLRQLEIKNAVDNDEVGSLLDLINHISNKEILSDTDIGEFLSTFSKMFNEHGFVWTADNLGESQTKELLRLVNVWQTRSGYFELNVGMLDDFMIKQLYSQGDGSPTLPPPAFLLGQSNFVSLYQIANPSVAPQAHTFIQKRNSETQTFPESFQGGIVSYKEILGDNQPDYKQLLETEIATTNFIRQEILKDTNVFR